MADANQQADIAGHEFLAFTLGKEEYGIDIQKVSEIRNYEAPTRIASAPEFVKGVINLRGIIVPIVDMRIAFGPRPPEHDPGTDVIILKLSSCVMGMVTDGITDIVSLARSQIKPFPNLSAEAARDADYLLGLAETGERRLIVLDIDRLMAIRRVNLGSRHAA